MEADYLAAALPARVVLLGQRLHPLSIGHVMLLLRFQSPFLPAQNTAALQHSSTPAPPPKPRKPDPDDLVFAVGLCAQTWEENLACLHDPDWLTKLQEYRDRKLKKVKWPLAFAQFYSYLANGMTWPDTYQPEGNDRIPGAPFIQRLRLVLQAKLNFTPAEVFNYPYGAAVYDYLGFLELEDRLRILGETDLEHLHPPAEVEALLEAELARQRADIAARNGGANVP